MSIPRFAGSLIVAVVVGVVMALLVGMAPLAVVVTVAAQEATPEATPATPIATPVALTDPTDDQLRQFGVNELGVVPVVMYHTFTNDPAQTTEWTRTLKGFREQLQRFYDMGFTVITMRDLLENRISVPLGRHPMVLTFDDSSASQFLIDQHPDGSITPRPDSAVGVMEEFFAKHPDFGHTAFFAVVPAYCFSDASIDAVNSYDTCEAKLQWLVDHGYEIGNHTMHHKDLSKIPVEGFVEEVGGTAQWIDERVSGPGNMSHVLVLPYGGRPPSGSGMDSILNGWFRFNGEDFLLEAIVDVSGGPMFSPSSTWFDYQEITRINSDPEALDPWLESFAQGDVTLFTSDGNPDTVTVPNPIPDYLVNEFSTKAIKESGKRLIRYDVDPASGSTPIATPATATASPPPGASPVASTASGLAIGGKATTTDGGVRLREEPGTNGEVLEELDDNAEVTIIDGPRTADGMTWWKIECDDGATGWVVADYLTVSV